MRRLINIIEVLVVAGILGAIIYFYGDKLQIALRVLEQRYLPCQAPIQYSLGDFSPKFGLTQTDFIHAISEAENIWEEPISKDLFEYNDGGALKINFVYDYRQEATDRLKKMGLTINSDKATYDALVIRHDALVTQYNRDKAQYDKAVSLFEQRKKAYEKEVDYWNSKGGAPAAVYDRLNQEKIELDMQAAQLNQTQDKINSLVDDINALVSVINRLVSELNLDVDKYNTVSGQRGEEFQEGIYKIDATGQEIDIYEFDNQTQLVRVLTHEMGHALDLEHSDDPTAIMYRLNQASNEKLSQSDIDSLKAKCGVK